MSNNISNNTNQQANNLSIEQAFTLAVAHQNSGHLAQSEQLLRQILQHKPKHADAIHLLGIIAHQSNQTELAVKLIADAIAINPAQALFHSNRGEMCRLLGRLDGAIDHGKQAIKLNPNSASFLSNLGIAYYDNNELEEAEKHQKMALKEDPNCLPALNNLGSISRDQKDKEKAIDYYNKVISINPNHIESISNLGAVLTEQEQFDEAVKTLLRAIQLNPHYAEAHCNIATAFMGQENFPQALHEFEQALTLKNDYTEAFIGIARIQKELNQLPQAEVSANKALELDKDNSAAYQILGGIYIEQSFPLKARQAFDKALELDPESNSAYVGIGTLEVQNGNIEIGEEYFNKALDITPNDLSARISISQARKAVSGEENLLKLEEKLLSIDTMAPSKAMPLHFALGKCYDDLNRDNEAFKHFTKGCEIKRSKIDHNADSKELHTHNIIDYFTAEKIESLHGSGNLSNTPIFVLGMPRSGTTLTEQILSSHPQVFGAGELPDLLEIANAPLTDGGEIGFPGSIRNITSSDLTTLGNQYIERLKQRAPDVEHITDKMPANFYCVGLIHLILPNAKIIHIRRNPIDTCVSGFSKLFNHGQTHSYDLTELGRYYRSYDRLMRHWHKVIPTDNFMEIQYEDLVADNEKKSKELISFIGLDWNEACLNFHQSKRSVRTASVTQVRKPIYNSSIEKWRRYESHLEPLLEALGDLAQ